jgi:hypothetical protein
MSTNKYNGSKYDGNKYSPEEVDKYKNLGKLVSQKVVVFHLGDIVRTYVNISESARKELLAEIELLMPKTSSNMSMDFVHENVRYDLCIGLAPCKPGYVAEIYVPNAKYKEDLYKNFQLITNIVHAYWSQFRLDNAELMKKIEKALPDVDFSQIHIAEGTNSMYIHQKCNFHIGIIPFYMDGDKPLIKKRN